MCVSVLLNAQIIKSNRIDPVPEEVRCDSTEIVEWYETQEKPVFPGGEAELYEFIKARAFIPEYCDTVAEKVTVFMSFVIERDGGVSTFKCMNDVHGSCDYDKLATKILKQMPAWKPGIRCEKPARTRLIVPVRFAQKVE